MMAVVAQPECCLLPESSLLCFMAPATSSSGKGTMIQATCLNVYRISTFFQAVRGKPENPASWDTAFCARPLRK